MNERHRAEIRGGVMEEGKARDAVCFFPSESQDAAFRHALEIGYRERRRSRARREAGWDRPGPDRKPTLHGKQSH
jgi:hypothetical protein